jgi:hypothetical protein
MMTRTKIIGLGLILGALGGMVPVPDVGEKVPPPGTELPTPELEGLLHFAIRNSDLTKLHEMAEKGSAEYAEKFDALIEALAESDRVLKDVVNQTLVARSWKTEDDFLAGIELLMDYGDHLVDKGDMLHKMNALEPLLDWVVDFNIVEPKWTLGVLEGLVDLVTELTQNREPSKKLIMELRPDFVDKIPQMVISNQWGCLSGQNDSLCGSFVMALNAMIGNNPELQAKFDKSEFPTLAAIMIKTDASSTFFNRLLSTFKVLVTTGESAGTEWIKAIDLDALISEVSSANQIGTGLRIIDLVEQIAKRRSVSLDLTEARKTVYAKCIEQKGKEDEWCQELNPDGGRKVDHSTEL